MGVTYDDASLGAFLDDIASERVAPAGGSAVAVTGAMGAALCEMVCTHTLAARDGDVTRASAERDGDADRPTGGDGDRLTVDSDADETDPTDGPTLERLRADLNRRRQTLLDLAERDAALVDELFGGEAETSDRLRKRAAGIPLAIAEASLAVLEGAAVASERGRPDVAADAETGAYLADAAVRASLATVRVNLRTISDQSVGSEIAARADAIERSAAAVRTEVLGELFR